MYSLIGVDGNAFAVMGYTARALKKTGHRDLVDQMHKEATAGDYYNLIAVCNKYINIANGDTTYCDIYKCSECPRYGDDCDGKEADDATE